MTNYPLEYAVKDYEAAIAALESAEQVTAEQILNVLVARDQVHAALNREQLSSAGLIRTIRAMLSGKHRIRYRRLTQTINGLDARLRQQATYNRAVKLEWQVLLNPWEREWLQLLETPTHWRDRYDWLWQGLSLFLLTLSLSLLTPLATRFLSGGPDDGIFAIIFPTVLALLTGGGALTKTGRQAVEHMLVSLRLPKYWWDEVICLLSLALLVFLIGFWNVLPSISNYYMQAGQQAYNTGQLTSARRLYERAVKLNGENSEAHYRLGKVYKELRQTNNAVLEYEIAVRDTALKPEYVLDAYNTLLQAAVRRLDYAQADLWLQECLANPDSRLTSQCAIEDLSKAYLKAEKYTDAAALLLSARYRYGNFERYSLEKRYTLITDLGRAFLGQKLPAPAEDALRQAIALDNERAPAHCLLAQTLEQRKEYQGALTEWEQCIAYTSLENSEEAIWLNVARQRLAIRGEQQ